MSPFKRYPPPFTPKPTAAERRRELLEDEADRQAHERPNVPPRLDPHYTVCTQSKYSTHRFVLGAGRVIRCEFCGRLEIDVRVRG